MNFKDDLSSHKQTLYSDVSSELSFMSSAIPVDSADTECFFWNGKFSKDSGEEISVKCIDFFS